MPFMIGSVLELVKDVNGFMYSIRKDCYQEEKKCIAVENKVLTGHKDSVAWAAFSPDKSQLVSGSCDRSVKIWNTDAGNQSTTTLRGHRSCVDAGAVSSDGDGLIIASGSNDETVKLWDATTGVLKETVSLTSMVRSVAFSPAPSTDSSVKVWNVATGKHKFLSLPDHYGVFEFNNPNPVAFSPDGRRVANGSDCACNIWNVDTGELELTLLGHTGVVWSVQFAPDGCSLVTGSVDETVRLWNTNAGNGGQCERMFSGHLGAVLSVTFSPDGLRLFSGSTDETVKIWNVRTGVLEQTLAGHTGKVRSVAVSCDGTMLASCSHDETIKLYTVAYGKLHTTHYCPHHWVQRQLEAKTFLLCVRRQRVEFGPTTKVVAKQELASVPQFVAEIIIKHLIL